MAQKIEADRAKGGWAAYAGRHAERQLARSRGRILKTPRQATWGVVAAWQAGIVVAIFAAWEIGAEIGLIDTFFWSRPILIWEKTIVFVQQGDAYIDTWYTLAATVLGFVYGTVGGAIIGLSFWWSRTYATVSQPFIIVFHAMPKFALAPLVVLVFGLGMPSKVAMGVALTIVVTILTTFAAVRAVDQDSEKLFYSLGASRWQVFTKLVVPSVMPWIIASLRVNIGLALAGAIVGEFISSQHGLGRAILYAGQVYDIALIWVGVFILSILAVLMYVGVAWIERLLLKGFTHDTAPH
ncbi:MAG: ABC transporter permease [Rhodospirillaceae bacterium]